MNAMMDDVEKLAKELEQDRDRIREEVRRQLGLGESWFKRKWWLGWVLLLFIAGCSLIWAVTR